MMKPQKFGDYSRGTTTDPEAQVHAGVAPDDDEPGYGAFPYDVDQGEWAIWLPHDCDEWVIASGDRDAVIAKGRQFIAAVEAAIRHIEEAP